MFPKYTSLFAFLNFNKSCIGMLYGEITLLRIEEITFFISKPRYIRTKIPYNIKQDTKNYLVIMSFKKSVL